MSSRLNMPHFLPNQGSTNAIFWFYIAL